ncbi:MAG: hypothetical protein IK102_10600 [Treponema sp.]|nr:hypothetical protein [Treponema sp.]
MKALIISEDQKVCDTLNETLVDAGYDTIIYKWLLKALDNIEEIHPDCIVVSSSEYPRHWKTLVQFVKSGIGGDNVDIYLYEPNPMSDEDEEKARILGITDYFTTLEKSELQKIFKKVQAEPVAKPEPVAEPEPVVEPESVVEPAPYIEPDPEPVPEPDFIPEPIIEEDPVSEASSIPNSGHFMFTHPVSKKFVTGKYFDFNGKTMSCQVQNLKDIEDINKNSKITCFTFFDSEYSHSAKVNVKDVLNISSDNKILVIETVEIYEKV